MQDTRKNRERERVVRFGQDKTVDQFFLVHNVFTFITERFWTLRTGIC